MMYYSVYALRDRTDQQIRYIGQSVYPKYRLSLHINTARSAKPSTFNDWLLSGRAEIVELDACATRQEALSLERAMIRAFVALGAPLFNLHGVPEAKRLPRHVDPPVEADVAA